MMLGLGQDTSVLSNLPYETAPGVYTTTGPGESLNVTASDIPGATVSSSGAVAIPLTQPACTSTIFATAGICDSTVYIGGALAALVLLVVATPGGRH